MRLPLQGTVFGLGEEPSYDAPHMPAISITEGTDVLRSKHNNGDRKHDEKGEQQLLHEHIVTPVSIFTPRTTHVFTSSVIG